MPVYIIVRACAHFAFHVSSLKIYVGAENFPVGGLNPTIYIIHTVSAVTLTVIENSIEICILYTNTSIAQLDFTTSLHIHNLRKRHSRRMRFYLWCV